MIGSWLRHPYTVKTRQTFENLTTNAHHELLTECENSTDARVRGAHSRYNALRELVRHFYGTSAEHKREQFERELKGARP